MKSTINAGQAMIHWTFKKKSITCILVNSEPKRLLAPDGPKHTQPLMTILAAAD